MKDKTLAMNSGVSAEDAARGYSDPGEPSSTHADKKRRMAQGALLDTTLGEVENLDVSGYGRGGFLKRNNFGDRF